jgi:hypothetical protein
MDSIQREFSERCIILHNIYETSLPNVIFTYHKWRWKARHLNTSVKDRLIIILSELENCSINSTLTLFGIN